MNMGNWTPYLSARALDLLEALKIAARPDHEGAQSFSEAAIRAQRDADESGEQIVLGWQINDVSGDREPGWGPVKGLEFMALEPVAMLYPLQRNPLKCKPRK